MATEVRSREPQEPRPQLTAPALWGSLIAASEELPDGIQSARFKRGLKLSQPEDPAHSLFYFEAPLRSAPRIGNLERDLLQLWGDQRHTDSPQVRAVEAILEQPPTEHTKRLLYVAAASVIGISQEITQIDPSELLYSQDIHGDKRIIRASQKFIDGGFQAEPPYSEITLDVLEQLSAKDSVGTRYLLKHDGNGSINVLRHPERPVTIKNDQIQYPDRNGNAFEMDWREYEGFNRLPFIPAAGPVSLKSLRDRTNPVGEFEAHNIAMAVLSSFRQ